MLPLPFLLPNPSQRFVERQKKTSLIFFLQQKPFLIFFPHYICMFHGQDVEESKAEDLVNGNTKNVNTLSSWNQKDVPEEHSHDLVEITEMDYSPAKRKPPIHNWSTRKTDSVPYISINKIYTVDRDVGQHCRKCCSFFGLGMICTLLFYHLYWL